MTKKFSWDLLERGGLLLQVADGPKVTTWTIRKTTGQEALRQIFEEIQLAMWEHRPFAESMSTIDAEELASLRAQKGTQSVSDEIHEFSEPDEAERASRAALAAKAQAAVWTSWGDTEDLEFKPLAVEGAQFTELEDE